MLRLLAVAVFLIAGCKTVGPGAKPAAPRPKAEPAEPIPKAEPKPLPLPAPDAYKPLGLILIGDMGTGTKGQYQVADAMGKYCGAELCSYALGLGDNIYPDGVKNQHDKKFIKFFEKPYASLKFPFYMTLGNHDLRGSWEAQVHYRSKRWLMPSRYYTVTHGNVQLWGIDSNLKAFQSPFSSKRQREWLEKSLAESKARYKIVFGHHPIYSSGSHGGNFMVARYLKPLLIKYGCQFYVAGHDHDLELIEYKGVRQIISGAGGKLRKIKGGKHSLFAKSDLGFAHMLLEKDRVRLRFINARGSVLYEKLYKGIANK